MKLINTLGWEGENTPVQFKTKSLKDRNTKTDKGSICMEYLNVSLCGINKMGNNIVHGGW